MPRVYVGTYAKYNSGSIRGAWIDLEDYQGDREGFLTACKALHSDEPDPELMFQDYEGFPAAYYSESGLSDELFEWLDLDEVDRELLQVYLEHVDNSGDLEAAREAFLGLANSEREWAEQWLEDTGQLSELPDWAANYFDFDAYARDARLSGDVTFVRHDGELWVFRS